MISRLGTGAAQQVLGQPNDLVDPRGDVADLQIGHAHRCEPVVAGQLPVIVAGHLDLERLERAGADVDALTRLDP